MSPFFVTVLFVKIRRYYQLNNQIRGKKNFLSIHSKTNWFKKYCRLKKP